VYRQSIEDEQDEEKSKINHKFEKVRGQIQIEDVSAFVLPSFDLNLILIHLFV